jgi:hypothetical protein
MNSDELEELEVEVSRRELEEGVAIFECCFALCELLFGDSVDLK